MIRSYFKNTILMLSTIGLAAGIHAADGHTPKAASAGATAAATSIMGAGSIATFLGIFGANAPMHTIVKEAPYLASLTKMGSYTCLMIPGILATVCSAAYLFKAAQSTTGKVRSTIGSILTTIGGLTLTFGALNTYDSGENILPMVAGLAGTGLMLIGYAIQPSDK